MSTQLPRVHTAEDSERRFTDQEVALVLQRAAELEEGRADAAVAPHGLTLHQLREVAREVGIRPDAIDAAVTALDHGLRPPRRELLGMPVSTKVVRGVRGALSREAQQQLIRILEDQVDSPGTVSEALGTVRWTTVARDQRFEPALQVALSTHPDETQIQVVQRFQPVARTLLHALPMAWGGMIGLAIGGSMGAPTLAVAGLVVGTAALGVGIGRGVWGRMARRSAAQVDRLATTLATAARELPPA